MIMKTHFRIILLGMLVAFQSYGAKHFSPADQSLLKGKPQGQVPQSFQLYTVDLTGISQELLQAPKEKMKTPIAIYGLEISLPVANLGDLKFRIADIPVMEGKSQENYPEIKTFTGQCVEKPSFTLKMDITPLGIHAAVFGDDDIYLIEPIALKSNVIMAYKFSDFPTNQDFRCLAEGHPKMVKPNGANNKAAVTMLGAERREYRLALATNVNFVTFYGGTSALALAAVVSKINQVNGIYERDFAIRLNLIANSISLMGIFNVNNYGSGSPDTHNTIVAALGGSTGFDVGHYLGVINNSGTGVSGNADVGAVCGSRKGAGYSQAELGAINTSRTDLFALPHELGHMFGATHTFNSSCSGARAPETAFEPGTGNSIMSYWYQACEHTVNDGGLVPFFHSGSWFQVSNFTTTGSAGYGCATKVNTVNAVPTANAGSNFYLPLSTPLLLTGTSSDEAADIPNLTHSWDQMDVGSITPPNSPTDNAPLFRMREPSTSNQRTLPVLNSILTGTSTVGETLPSYARRFRMAFLVRDNRAGGGATRVDTASYYVVGTAGPFAITSPTSATTAGQGTSLTVTWNVAGTNTSPISTSSVAIDISINDGATFTTLLSSTPNDGSQAVTLPASSMTTNARIRVRAVNNIYFAISQKFTITLPSYGTVPSGDQPVCYGGDPINISLTTTGMPASKTYQWYYKDGLVTQPLNTDPIATWVLITAATASSYNPPVGLTTNRTYACRVISASYPGGSGWATGVRKVSVLPPLNFGTLAAGNQTFNETGNPSVINFSVLPSGGNESFAYRWYQAEGLVSAPTGTTVPSNWTLISGANSNFYDPPAVFRNTSYAVMVDPTGSQNCAGYTWASGVRQISITNGCNATICRPSMTAAPFLYINSVTLAGVTNNSGNNNGYGFYSFTNYVTTGQSVNFTLQVAANTTLAPTTQAYYRIFADWNKNGVIDATESVYNTTVSPLSSVTGSFTIPATAAGGRTTIRVSMTTFSTTSACWSSSDLESGEVEDYCIYVSKGLNPGSITGLPQNLCNGSIPGAMTVSGFSPSTATFQWYYKDVITSAPGASEGLDGFAWTLITGANSATYSPTSTFSGSRTYACRVSANGSTLWASGVRQVTIKPALNVGTLAEGNQTFTGSGDPNPIAFSTSPSGGSGSFTYQWYRANGILAAPTGTAIPGGWTLISGATMSSYDPPVTESSLSFAVMVNPAGSPDCGAATWASGVRQITVNPFSPGVIAAGDQTICNGAGPASILFSTAPSPGSTYQWYYKDGLVAAPANTDPIGTWQILAGQTGSFLTPGATFTNRTFACRVTNGSVSQWATGVRQVTVLPAFNPGTIASGDQSLCANGNPAPISLSVAPVGSSSFSYQWYYKNAVVACPTGGSASGWIPVSTGGTGTSYDPQSANTTGRTFVLLVTPGGATTCGTPTFANSCRKITVIPAPCSPSRIGVADEEREASDESLAQNIPNPFSDETRIAIEVPEKSRHAYLEIYTLDGRILEKIPVKAGSQEITLTRKQFPAAGMYLYTLMLDGAQSQMKKLVVL